VQICGWVRKRLALRGRAGHGSGGNRVRECSLNYGLRLQASILLVAVGSDYAEIHLAKDDKIVRGLRR